MQGEEHLESTVDDELLVKDDAKSVGSGSEATGTSELLVVESRISDTKSKCRGTPLLGLEATGISATV